MKRRILNIIKAGMATAMSHNNPIYIYMEFLTMI